MNGKTAKRLRREHFGDYSHQLRKYSTGPNGEIIEIGPRGRYRKAKQKHKNCKE